MEQFLKDRRVGISISDSGNLAELGLIREHVEDDLVEVTRYLLAAGATVVYGGDLRANGFTNLLLEVIARHQRPDDSSVRFENFLAWPVHSTKPYDELVEIERIFQPAGRLKLLSLDGKELTMKERSSFDTHDPVETEWGPALSAMRRHLASHCDIRIVAGGATTNFKGSMPGIAEETVLSLEAKKPTFVIGALGGCALDIGLRCGLAKAPVKISTEWPGLDKFDGLAGVLNPGLEPEDSSALASTIPATDMLILLLKGLHSSIPARPEDVRAELR